MSNQTPSIASGALHHLILLIKSGLSIGIARWTYCFSSSCATCGSIMPILISIYNFLIVLTIIMGIKIVTRAFLNSLRIRNRDLSFFIRDKESRKL